ncbi:protein DEK isoform X1 [Tachysurus fulvidraco]|uniref:protein DEK isoform X1 n=1 Tax=Tachysurus fulvidraco TaxID=1234273 RepID=UPI001FF024A6|nr:protein DEK isoform X1 [Tachysurus fulvidraco]
MSSPRLNLSEMTDTMEVEMKSAATNEAIHDIGTKGEQDESVPHKPKSRIFPGEIIEGKREKKTVQRFNMQMGKPKEKLKIESIGHGDKLGDIARVNHAIGKLKAPQLKPLHKILYDRPGAVSSLRKHLRLFNGFPFESDSDPYNKKKEKVLKLPKIQLRTICQILDLERSGTQCVLVERIMQFLINPTNSGKPVILKKKRKKKSTKDAKREKKILAKSKHQQLESGKSKAIVTDSSSDEADEDEDKSKNKDGEKTDSQKHEDEESMSEEEENMDSDEEPEDDEDEEVDKYAKAPKSKKPSSKKNPATKKDADSDQAVSDDDDDDDDDDGNDDESAEDTPPKIVKKKPAPQKKVKAKPAPKTKKADSSSNRKKNNASKTKLKIESSDDDDDEPLIKMIKKPPSNEQLKSAVKDLLKDANLEEVTMKQICQQVYDLYPDFDLTSRKDFIKQTVKSLLS